MTNQKIVRYVPKFTAAKTNYREISQEDMAFLQQEWIRWLAIMSELDQSRAEDDRWVRDQWWHKRTSTLPKGEHGQNTPASFVGGLINNFVFGTQRDITDRQMDAVQNISHIMGSAFPDTCHDIRFQIGFDV